MRIKKDGKVQKQDIYIQLPKSVGIKQEDRLKKNGIMIGINGHAFFVVFLLQVF